MGASIYREGVPAGLVGLAPYYMAIVELLDGLKITARLTDWGEKKPEIGQEVEMVTRKMRDGSDESGIIKYGYCFRQLIPKSLSE